jgi:hypothetical protein
LFNPVVKLATGMQKKKGVESIHAFCSGRGGIRTHGTVARTQHFQCCTFSLSVTRPAKILKLLSKLGIIIIVTRFAKFIQTNDQRVRKRRSAAAVD